MAFQRNSDFEKQNKQKERLAKYGIEKIGIADEVRFTAAYRYAALMHKGQKRIGGADYITHPLAVAKMLYEKSYPIEYLITGLFHDLLEDTAANEKKIEHLGGEEVLKAVKLLTKEHGYSMADYITRIKANPMAKAVKNADRLNNLQGAVCAKEKFKRKYIIETIEWYLDFSWDIHLAVIKLADTLASPIYELLFQFIPYFEKKPHFKRVESEQDTATGKFTPVYSSKVIMFVEVFYMSGVGDKGYLETLNKHNVDKNHRSIMLATPEAGEEVLRAMLTCYILQERFFPGILGEAIENGNMAEILKRLKKILV